MQEENEGDEGWLISEALTHFLFGTVIRNGKSQPWRVSGDRPRLIMLPKDLIHVRTRG